MGGSSDTGGSTATGGSGGTPGSDEDGDGYTVDEGDCDDADENVHPGASEVCDDGKDNDCDGAKDADELDGDDDGVTVCDGDCDDTKPEVNPSALEVCDDGIDNDCDGEKDAGELDDDGDGTTLCMGDCDDGDDSVHPGAAEICDDGKDNDCDGAMDAAELDEDGDGVTVCAGDCDDTSDAIGPHVAEICDDGIDNDCDGAMDAAELDGDGDGITVCGGDCNDADPAVHPGAAELCADGVDNDCDGAMDAAELDGDGDGITVCAGDCDDTKDTVHPGADEVCENAADDDCNGETDTDCPACELAALHPSSEGCEFFAYDANNDPLESHDAQQYAVDVANTGSALATVQVQTRSGLDWNTIATQNVAPGANYVFNLPDRHINYSGVLAAGAYRIVSDQPVSARQFQPLAASNVFTSDASTLLPVAGYDSEYLVAGWGKPSFGEGQITIIASEDDTVVTLTASTTVAAGGSVTAITAGAPTVLPTLNAGDFIQLNMPANTPAGTRVVADKPVAVFSANWCANVPTQVCCCDHIEEQLYGVSQFGTQFVAARMPVRSTGTPEQTYWQIVANEDDTTVTFDAAVGVTGLPGTTIMMAGQVLQFGVSGTIANPGDFLVSSDKPVILMSFLTSAATTNAGVELAGDPSMAIVPAADQLLDNYVVTVPAGWTYDYLTVFRPVGAQVLLDGVAMDDGLFIPVGQAGDWQVARVATTDGVHSLVGSAPFGARAVGVAAYHAYSYPAGMALSK